MTRFAGGEKRRSVGAIDGKDGLQPSSVSHFKSFVTLPPSLFYSDPSWKIEPLIIRRGRGGVCVKGGAVTILSNFSTKILFDQR